MLKMYLEILGAQVFTPGQSRTEAFSKRWRDRSGLGTGLVVGVTVDSLRVRILYQEITLAYLLLILIY